MQGIYEDDGTTVRRCRLTLEARSAVPPASTVRTAICPSPDGPSPRCAGQSGTFDSLLSDLGESSCRRSLRQADAVHLERGMRLMKRQHLWMYAAAAAAVLIAVAAYGSSGYLFGAVFLLLCPLMMIFMMGGMHGGGGHGGDGPEHTGHSTAASGSVPDIDPSSSGGRSP